MSFHFSKLSFLERLQNLLENQIINQNDFDHLISLENSSFIPLADQMVENTIGVFNLPYGILPNLWMDNKQYYVPMVVEESSVIAAISSAAKWVLSHGKIETKRPSRFIIGQIHFTEMKNIYSLETLILEKKNDFINLLNQKITHGMYARGGGIQDIYLRKISHKNQQRAVIHLLLDPCDAMGANIINQACEYFKDHLIKLLPDENPLMCILSNFNDQSLVQCKITLNDIEKSLAQRIVEASLCASIDPYRAATHNKGIFNGIDAVLIATGNDWRAVEAGGHAYAASTGQYLPLSHWYQQGSSLIGELELPMNIGIIGGATNILPLAQLSLRIMKIKSADELARVVASVGLLQNLAALRALVSIGITQGHMNLHLKNWLTIHCQTPEEYAYAESILQKQLKEKKTITMSDVKQIVENFRQSLKS